MRIVAVVGIWDFQRLYGRLWKNFELAFVKEFPQARFTVEHLWYSPWQGKKMRTFAADIVRKYDDGGEDIILLGYSMGGVIATAITPKFTKTKVRAIVSVWGPHTFLWGLFSRMLGSNLQKLSAPVISFSARLDYFVPWGARYPAALVHKKLWCDHLLGLLLSGGSAKTIAQTTKTALHF